MVSVALCWYNLPELGTIITCTHRITNIQNLPAINSTHLCIASYSRYISYYQLPLYLIGILISIDFHKCWNSIVITSSDSMR